MCFYVPEDKPFLIVRSTTIVPTDYPVYYFDYFVYFSLCFELPGDALVDAVDLGFWALSDMMQFVIYRDLFDYFS